MTRMGIGRFLLLGSLTLATFQPLTNTRANSTVVAWGIVNAGQTNVPANLTNAIAIAAGGDHALVLKADGTLMAWGQNLYGQANIPAGLNDVAVIAAGYSHNLALTKSGQVIAWGMNTYGQTNVPSGLSNVVAIAAGPYHNLALTAEGTVIGWGQNGLGQTNVPAGLKNVVGLSAAVNQSQALTAEGKISAWGLAGGTYVPRDVSNAVAAAAGDTANLALLSDSTVRAWGNSGLSVSAGQMTNVPAGLSNVVAISAANDHALALRNNGTVASWGSLVTYVAGRPRPVPATAVPAGLTNVMAVASGEGYSLALVDAGTLSIKPLPAQLEFAYGSTAYLRADVQSGFPYALQWQFNAQDLPGATNAVLILPQLQLESSGNYSLVASNASGPVFSTVTALTVLPLSFTLQPQTAQSFKGGDAAFSAAAASPEPVCYHWLFNSAPIADATNTTLVLTNVQFAQAGQYSMVASNQLGVISSLPAALNVVSVAVWGSIAQPPPNVTNIVSIAGGYGFELALRRDGKVLGWGNNSSGQTNIPPGLTNAVAVSANTYATLALRADGTILAWGNTPSAPAGLSNVVSISAGSQHALALTSDGKVTGWGQGAAATNPPPDLRNVIAIAAGSTYSLALTGDGTVVAWGDNTYATNVPGWLHSVVDIAAGSDFALALRSDGSVVAWGSNPFGETNVPNDLTAAIAISAGSNHGEALLADGTVRIWGNPPAPIPVTNVPPGLRNVSSIASGFNHASAAVEDGPPFLLSALLPRNVVYGADALLFARASGAGPLTYQWRCNGTNLPGATSAVLTLSQVQFDASGLYSVVISNPFGSVTNTEALLTVIPARITSQPVGATTFRGDNVSLAVGVNAAPPLHYQWRVNHIDLPGAFSSTLVLSNAQPQRSGSYDVIINNSVGSVTSAVAQVAINDVAIWGDSYSENAYGLTPTPSGLTNIAAMAAGRDHDVLLKRDGTVIEWGENYYGTNAPVGLSNVINVAASMTHSLALLADGTVVGWGRNSTPPPDLTNVVSIAAGIDFSVALKADGTIVTWGFDVSGSLEAPAGLSNVAAVAACSYAGLALKRNGTLVAWGWGYHGQTNLPPVNDVVAIASGYDFCAALIANGKVVVWGDNTLVEPVPSDLAGVIGIACGFNSISALKSDGTVAVWGTYMLNEPALVRNVTAITSGYYEALALIGDAPPAGGLLLPAPQWSQSGGFSVAVPTLNAKVYSLEYKDDLSQTSWVPLPLVAGNGNPQVLRDANATGSQRFYRLRRW